MGITPSLEIDLRLKNSTYRKLAKELGFDQAYLCRVSMKQVPASDRLLEALGLERVVKVSYRRKRTNGTELATR
jgi:hypothetical protein